jgi:hypothetical protein
LINGAAVKLPLMAITQPCCFANSFFHSSGLMLLISDLFDWSFIMDILIAMATISKKWIMLFMCKFLLFLAT